MGDIKTRITATCSGLDTEDLRRSCEELANSCVRQSETRGTKEGYSLSLPNGKKILPYSLQDCFTWSATITRIFGPIPRKDGSRDNAPATAQPADDTHVEESFAPDNKTKFAIRLAEAGLRLVTDKPITLEGLSLRTYHNGDIRGVRTNISYSVVSLGDGRYRMKYTITNKDGASFGDEESIEFEARDGKIVDDLAFGIELGEEGNFGNVASVKIVKL